MKKIIPECAAAVLFAALLFLSCEQTGGGFVPSSSEQQEQEEWEGWEEEEEPPPVVVGMAIASLPSVTYYPKNGTFSADGLKLVKVYSNGGTEPVDGGFTLNPSAPDTGVAGQKLIWVYWGEYKDYFTVYVDNSTVIPTDIEIVTPPKTEYYLGDKFDTSKMVINGVYSDGTKKTIDNGAVSADGYDSYKRGKQTVTLRMNQGTALVDVTVKVSNASSVSVTGNTVYLKGKEFNFAASKLKAVVTQGNVGVNLTPENGGLKPSDISGYDKDKAEGQTLKLALDDKAASLRVFVVDAAPAVWFDFGYMRHESDPQGHGLGEGKFYTRPNVPLVLAPVRYLIGWNDDHSPASGTAYSWSVTSPSGGAYDTGAAANKETFAFKPSVAGTYTVKVKVTGRDFITGGTTAKEASVQVVCGAGTVAPHREWKANSYGVRILRNFAPGQFTESGNGYGWSLGSIGGYAVWDVKKHQADYQINGNAFAGWNEHGVVWVQEDNNGNGLPDEMWYELTGGDDKNADLKPLITRRYAIAYMKFGSGNGAVNEYGQIVGKAIYWADCRGRAGYIPYGWPAPWGVVGNKVTYTCTLLRDTGSTDGYTGAIGDGGNSGYVDTTASPMFYVNNAIDTAGNSVTLTNVRFVKVHTAIFRYGGIFGEVSTEITTASGFGTSVSMTMF
jgi:hypothetical protein